MPEATNVLQLDYLCSNHVRQEIKEQKKDCFKLNQTSFRSMVWVIKCIHFINADRLSLNRLKIVIVTQSGLFWLHPKVESSGLDQIQDTHVKKILMSPYHCREFKST